MFSTLNDVIHFFRKWIFFNKRWVVNEGYFNDAFTRKIAVPPLGEHYESAGIEFASLCPGCKKWSHFNALGNDLTGHSCRACGRWYATKRCTILFVEKFVKSFRKYRFEADEQKAQERRALIETQEQNRKLEAQKVAEKQQEEAAKAAAMKREEADRIRRENEEAARLRRIEQLQLAANGPLWPLRMKLACCGAPARHYFPVAISGDCPLCGNAQKIIVDAMTGMSEHDFLRSFNAQLREDVLMHQDEKDEVPIFEKEINKRVGIKDFSGIGNRILELLLLPAQEKSPRESGRLLARRIPGIIAAKFGIHEDVTYLCPLRDELLQFSSRGKWPDDTFHQLAIFAHVLEPTWKAFPPPYDKLRAFYVKMAERQTEIILKVAQDRAGVDRQLNSRYPDAIKNRMAGIPPKPITEDDE